MVNKPSNTTIDTEELRLEPTYDGIYPRCVWCNGENYAPNVIDYSKGTSGCHQCGKLLPKSHIKLSNTSNKKEE